MATAMVLLLGLRQSASAADAQHGKELFSIASGCGCHTASTGPVGAGGGEVPTPFGTFYGTNITADRENGIGAWSDNEIAAAIRDGEIRGRGVAAPAMPYYWYAAMSDEDIADLVAYLRTLPAAAQKNRPHRDELPLARLAYRAWRAWFAPRFTRASGKPMTAVERGHYYVDHVAICGDCHTPRSRFGSPILSMYLAGTRQGPGNKPVPNITPHQTGIVSWDAADIMNLLKTTFTPEYDNVQGFMADVIEGHGGAPGYKHAPDSALQSIAAYLKTISPIDNSVERQ